MRVCSLKTQENHLENVCDVLSELCSDRELQCLQASADISLVRIYSRLYLFIIPCASQMVIVFMFSVKHIKVSCQSRLFLLISLLLRVRCLLTMTHLYFLTSYPSPISVKGYKYLLTCADVNYFHGTSQSPADTMCV